MRSAAERSAAKKGEGAAVFDAAALAALTLRDCSCARCAVGGMAVKRPTVRSTAKVSLRMFPPYRIRLLGIIAEVPSMINRAVGVCQRSEEGGLRGV